jgi:hypothetical protein
MAYVQAEPIRTRLREVLEQSAGTLRTVPYGRFSGGLPPGLAANEELRRAFESPRVNISIRRAGRNAQTPPIIGNILLDDYEFEVRVVRAITALEQLSDRSRDLIEALTMVDGDILRQALGTPGVLSETENGDATDIVSGLLRWQSSEWRVTRLVDEGAQLLETIHGFVGVVISRPAV